MYNSDRFERPTWRHGALSAATHHQLLRWLGEAVGGTRRRRPSFREHPRQAEAITLDPPEEQVAPARPGADRGLVIAVTLGLIAGGIVAAVLIATA